MAVNDNATQNRYTATAGQTVFSYTFEVADQAHIRVLQGNGSDTDTLLTLTTHYSVTGVGNDAGGTIVLVTGATEGDKITIEADPPVSRATRWATNSDFDVAELETELDAVQLRLQKFETDLRRCLAIRPQDLVSSPAAPDQHFMSLPSLAARAG